MKLTVINRTGRAIGLPSPASHVIRSYATGVYDVSVEEMQVEEAAWKKLQTKGYITLEIEEDVDLLDSLEDAPLPVDNDVSSPVRVEVVEEKDSEEKDSEEKDSEEKDSEEKDSEEKDSLVEIDDVLVVEDHVSDDEDSIIADNLDDSPDPLESWDEIL